MVKGMENSLVFANKRLERQLARAEALLQIGQQIASSQSLESVLQTTVEAINQYLHYNDVAIFLVDAEDKEMLLLKARSGVYVRGVDYDYGQSIHQGVIGQAARLRQTLLIQDVQQQETYIPIAGGEALCSELALPIMLDGQVLGVLNLESHHPISQDDVPSFETIAQQLAIAIANARRYEAEKRRTERLELIARVGQHIAARLDQDELFSNTIEELHTQLGFDHVSLFLIDAQDPSVLVQKTRMSRWARAETEPVGYRQSTQKGILGLAATQRKVMLIQDVHKDKNYIAVPGAAMHSELSVPLLVGERLLGVLDLASSRTFSPEDVKAVQIIADQLAVAIEHAYLFADTQQTLADTELLFETSRRISAANSTQEVARAYLELVAAQGKYNCTIVIYDFDSQGERKELLVLGRWKLDTGLSQELERHPYFKDHFDTALDAGQAVYMSHVPSDPRASKTLQEAQIERPALALIPLMVQGQRIGLVTLNHHQTHDWASADLRAYLVTAAQLATTLYNRKQQQTLLQREQALAVLNERQRLARDLHDSVNQLIFGMTLIAQSIGPAMQRSMAEGETRVNRLLELAQHVRAEMRALLTELRPSVANLSQPDVAVLKRDGLVKTLKFHLSRLPENLKVNFDAKGYVPQPLFEEALLRIAQEAVGNVVKHAQASQIDLQLLTDTQTCYLNVKDDGQGFSEGPRDGAHMGLRTMRERVQALGGEFNVESVLGQGTRIGVSIPIKKES
jgi:signal transduction histidine kinase